MFRISDLGFRVYQPCDGHPIHCPVHRRGNLFPHVFPEARFLARTFVRSCRWAFVRRKIPFHAAQDFSNAYFMWLPRQAIPSFYSSQRGDQPSAPQMMNQLFQVPVRWAMVATDIEASRSLRASSIIARNAYSERVEKRIYNALNVYRNI